MSWYEIVVEGDGILWETLLADQEEGSRQRAVRASEVPRRPESLGERLPGLPHAGEPHRVFAPGDLARTLVATLAGAEARTGLRLAQVSEVTGGHFAFNVEAFAEPYVQQIRAVLAEPPAGVEVRATEEAEPQGDPAAGAPRAIELHAPLHCRAYRAWGTVDGPLPALLEMHRRLCSLPFVYEEKIELAARRIDPAAWGPLLGAAGRET